MSDETVEIPDLEVAEVVDVGPVDPTPEEEDGDEAVITTEILDAGLGETAGE